MGSSPTRAIRRNNMNKCVECGKEAIYNIPDYFCDYHWHLWWYAEVFGDMTPEEFNECDVDDDERKWFKILQSGDRVKSVKAKGKCCCS